METQTVSEYEVQADSLLAGLGVRFSTKYLEHTLYFEDDTESRDVYRCTFRRGQQRFSVRFGQSIANSGSGQAPSTYDVVACLTKSDPGTFENFCGDFGYEIDSRKAERIYRAVVREWCKVARFFRPEEIAQLQKFSNRPHGQGGCMTKSDVEAAVVSETTGYKENLLQNVRYIAAKNGGTIRLSHQGDTRYVHLRNKDGRSYVVWFPYERRIHDVEIDDLKKACQWIFGIAPFTLPQRD